MVGRPSTWEVIEIRPGITEGDQRRVTQRKQIEMLVRQAMAEPLIAALEGSRMGTGNVKEDSKKTKAGHIQRVERVASKRQRIADS